MRHIRRTVSLLDDGIRLNAKLDLPVPAERWRLPTKAEINFIAQLSAQKVFEYLFTTGSGSADYWSANGAVTVNADKGTVTNCTKNVALLRCVYDSWYWDKVDGKEGDPRHNPRDRFIWGDKER